MKILKQARSEAKRLFRMCVSDGRLNPDRLRQVVARIAETRPRGYLPILMHLQRLAELEEHRRSARIESAAPLDAPLQANIRACLERRYGPGLDFQFAQKPGLLAGVRVQVGSDVYDATVCGRLDNLRQTFESE